MVLQEFYFGSDNVKVVITKEDKVNVDTMNLKTEYNTTISVGDEIKFYDENSDLAFAGYIQNLDTTGQMTLDCEDYGSILKRSIINKIYTDELAEDIIEDIVVSLGLTYISTVTTTTTIPIYTANKKNAAEIVEELADRLLSNYSTDVYKNFKLEVEGENTNSNVIDNSNGNINGSWEENLNEIINDIYVEGDDRSIFNTEESFNGNGLLVDFTLQEIPINFRVEHPVGTLLTGYVEGQSTGDYKIIREEKKITFDSPPVSGTNNIYIRYDYSIPISVRRRNKTSIDKYGKYSKIARKNWITTREDARGYADYIIQNFSEPLVNSTWSMTLQSDINNWQDYLPNEKIYVSDSLRNFANYYIIRKIVRKYGSGPTFAITVGSPTKNIYSWDKQVSDRVRQLEQRDNNATIINEDEFIEENIIQQYDSELTDIEKRIYASDTFYLSENGSYSRNQMVEAGTGPVMREAGYTPSDITSTTTATSVVTITYQESAISNFITEISTNISHIAVGDDDTTPVVTDTTLGNETYRETFYETPIITSTSISATMFMDTTENNGNDIKEVGIFDAGSGGNMYNHSLTNDIEKTLSKEVFIEIQFKFESENTTIP